MYVIVCESAKTDQICVLNITFYVKHLSKPNKAFQKNGLKLIAFDFCMYFLLNLMDSYL